MDTTSPRERRPVRVGWHVDESNPGCLRERRRQAERDRQEEFHSVHRQFLIAYGSLVHTITMTASHCRAD
jgi:hypothetical protein